jgi:hypothetical protein
MPTYKFQIGQTVFLDPAHNLNIPGGACIVTKKLPESNGELEYRVRSVNEPYERVVRESELRTVDRCPSLYAPRPGRPAKAPGSCAKKPEARRLGLRRMGGRIHVGTKRAASVGR